MPRYPKALKDLAMRFGIPVKLLAMEGVEYEVIVEPDADDRQAEAKAGDIYIQVSDDLIAQKKVDTKDVAAQWGDGFLASQHAPSRGCHYFWGRDLDKMAKEAAAKEHAKATNSGEGQITETIVLDKPQSEIADPDFEVKEDAPTDNSNFVFKKDAPGPGFADLEYYHKNGQTLIRTIHFNAKIAGGLKEDVMVAKSGDGYAAEAHVKCDCSDNGQRSVINELNRLTGHTWVPDPVLAFAFHLVPPVVETPEVDAVQNPEPDSLVMLKNKSIELAKHISSLTGIQGENTKALKAAQAKVDVAEANLDALEAVINDHQTKLSEIKHQIELREGRQLDLALPNDTQTQETETDDEEIEEEPAPVQETPGTEQGGKDTEATGGIHGAARTDGNDDRPGGSGDVEPGDETTVDETGAPGTAETDGAPSVSGEGEGNE